MAYTRNTRIKTTKFKHKQESVAEVEYKYPFINKTVWVDFYDTHGGLFDMMFCGDSVAFRAYKKALWDGSNENKKGYEWAQIIIDEYHRLLDEEEFEPVVEYTKYPD